MEKRCVNYVGLSCVDGSCPAALDEPPNLKMDCENCFYNKGCIDCALAGTEHCEKEQTMYKLNLSAKELDTIEAALILRRIDCQKWPKIYQDEIADIIALLEKLKTIKYTGEED